MAVPPPAGVVVLGGGIAGLAAGFYLRALAPAGTSITVLEAAARLGGWVHTTRHPDGVQYEHGPRTVRPVGPQGVNTLQLVEQLGLQDRLKVIRYGHPATKNRMVMVDGQLHKLPSSVWSMLRRLKPFSQPLALSALTDLLTPPQRGLQDDSMYAFAARRFGEEVARYAVDPLVRGVCAGDARQISVRFLMDQLFEYEQRHGGVLRGLWRERGSRAAPDLAGSALAERARRERWSVWSLEGGLQTLPETLAERLRADGVRVLTESPVSRLEFADRGTAVVHTPAGPINAQHVISALPAHALSPLLPGGQLSHLLDDILSVTVAVINLEYPGRQIIAEPGFGYLIPSSQPSDGVLGVIFDTCSFPQGERTVLTVMSGGAAIRQSYGSDRPGERQLLTAALGEIGRTLGVRQPPARVCVQLQDRCIPQYRVGHKALVQRIRERLTQLDWPLSLAGAAYDGVSVNDCILSGKRAAESVSKLLL